MSFFLVLKPRQLFKPFSFSWYVLVFFLHLDNFVCDSPWFPMKLDSAISFLSIDNVHLSFRNHSNFCAKKQQQQQQPHYLHDIFDSSNWTFQLKFGATSRIQPNVGFSWMNWKFVFRWLIRIDFCVCKTESYMRTHVIIHTTQEVQVHVISCEERERNPHFSCSCGRMNQKSHHN